VRGRKWLRTINRAQPGTPIGRDQSTQTSFAIRLPRKSLHTEVQRDRSAILPRNAGSSGISHGILPAECGAAVSFPVETRRGRLGQAQGCRSIFPAAHDAVAQFGSRGREIVKNNPRQFQRG